MSPPPVPDLQSGLMPRRQSCDRCHEQKVRCFTHEQEGVKGEGNCSTTAIAQGGRFISPYPCTRCKRAKATCIYSPQQRSGRPRLPRDPSSTTARKRARGTSRRPPSSTLESPTSSPLSSTSADSTQAPNTPNAISSSQQQQQQQQQDYLNLKLPTFSDTTEFNSPDWYTDYGRDQGQGHIDFSDWSPLTTSGPSCFSSTEFHVPSYTTPIDTPLPNPLVPLRSNARPDVERTRQSASQETVWSLDMPPKSYQEELAELNLRIYQSAHTLSSTLNRPCSTFTPSVNEIFDIARRLADLIEQYNAERAATTTCTPVHDQREESTSTYCYPYSSAFDATADPTTTTAMQSAMDASICVMIVGCHQSLLGAFETICAPFLVQLSELHESPSPAPTWPPGTKSQITSTTNMVNALLQRLERGIQSLDVDSDLSQPHGHDMGYHEPTVVQEMTPLPVPYDVTSGDFVYQPLHGDGHWYRSDQGMDPVTTSLTVFEQMEQQQERVKSQVKTIKKWIRKAGEMV